MREERDTEEIYEAPKLTALGSVQEWTMGSNTGIGGNNGIHIGISIILP